MLKLALPKNDCNSEIGSANELIDRESCEEF
jgi:hypothetical protein